MTDKSSPPSATNGGRTLTAAQTDALILADRLRGEETFKEHSDFCWANSTRIVKALLAFAAETPSIAAISEERLKDVLRSALGEVFENLDGMPMGRAVQILVDALRDLETTPSEMGTPTAEEIDLNTMGAMILLCGEDECRDVKGYAAKLRALIDGLIEAKRTAPSATRRITEGWKLVPLEPTPKMVNTAIDAFYETAGMADVIRAVIAAAPEAP